MLIAACTSRRPGPDRIDAEISDIRDIRLDLPCAIGSRYSFGHFHTQLTAKSTASPVCYCKVFYLSCFSGAEVKSSLLAYLYHFGKNGENTLFCFHFALCQTELIDCDSTEQTLQKAENPCRSGKEKRVLPGVVFAVLRALSKHACRDSAVHK